MFIQKLSSFALPPNFRGKSAFYVQLWWLVQSSLFKLSPQFAYPFRRFLLRLFGARIGSNVLIRPSVEVTYPWRLTVGDNCWIGDHVVLYTLGEISIGANVVISQKAYLCAADHDYRRSDFPIRSRPICVEDEVWVATDVYVGPDVTISRGAVIGARSSVFQSMPAGMVCVGSPCRVLKRRNQVLDESNSAH